MDYSKAMLSCTFLALTLMLIATPEASHAVSINGVVQLEILGTLFCTATGNPEPDCGGRQCPRLSGALVTVSCFGGATILGQVVTDNMGAIHVVVSAVETQVFDPSACSVFVELPVPSCGLLPQTGNIGSPLILLDVVAGANGGVARLTTGVFQLGVAIGN